MLCQVCNSRPAEVRLTQIINKQKTELHFCTVCAEERGVEDPLLSMPQMFGNVLSDFLDDEELEDDARKCSRCGLAWDDFQRTGVFGCEICYQVFENELKAILKKIHGTNRHIGSRPRAYRRALTAGELEAAREELQESVAAEDFERAAELRDLIRDARRELDQSDNPGT